MGFENGIRKLSESGLIRALPWGILTIRVWQHRDGGGKTDKSRRRCGLAFSQLTNGARYERSTLRLSTPASYGDSAHGRALPVDSLLKKRRTLSHGHLRSVQTRRALQDRPRKEQGAQCSQKQHQRDIQQRDDGWGVTEQGDPAAPAGRPRHAHQAAGHPLQTLRAGRRIAAGSDDDRHDPQSHPVRGRTLQRHLHTHFQLPHQTDQRERFFDAIAR